MAVEQWLLPAAVLTVQFLLKIFIDRTADRPALIGELLALPGDVAFLATSLLAGLIILSDDDKGERLAVFLLSFAVAIFAVVLLRRSERCFEADRFRMMFAMFSLNAAVTVCATAYAVHLLATGIS